jgi:hypothetical protein
MRPCRYYSTGFTPRRRLFVHGNFMIPDTMLPGSWHLRAMTVKRLAAAAYARYVEQGHRSVALFDGDHWHVFGPEWHGNCQHTLIDGDDRG